VERRLSAILAADVVGFASHNERDEAGTFERLRAHRKELFEPEIAKHHGRLFKLMGDGLLAEFNSVVEAVECAVALQRGMAERNDGVAADERIDVRIGINLGDVIIEGEDRHGEGVVIASRLQQLAKPGGIAVSGTVMEHVRRKLALRFEGLGEHQVKNIAAPVAVYRVPLDVIIPEAKRSGKRYGTWAVIAALGLLLVAGGGAAWRFASHAVPAREGASALPSRAAEQVLEAGAVPSQPGASESAEVSTRPSGQGIPVIIVLPFQDLSGGKIESDLGKGIAEEFLSDLATFPELEVVSSTSSFAYAGKSIPEIVKATGAQFVIEGSIRLLDGKALIRVQLINGTTDRHLQIAQIEQPLTDPVALQMEAARRLSDELGGMTGILRQEIEKISWAKQDAELTEYDFYIRGHTHHLRGYQFKAREIWREGLRRFPESTLMRCKLAFTYEGYSSQATELVKEAARLRKRSRLDEWYFHWISARDYAHHIDYKRAIAEAKAAIAMAPYDTLSHADLSWIATAAGDYEAAIAWAKFAATHDPHPKAWYFDNLIHAYDMADRWPDAVTLAEEELRRSSHRKYWYKVLARAYAANGQGGKAEEAQKKFDSLPYPPE
jgi:class 3 adenylate cyclase/TolB-like protein